MCVCVCVCVCDKFSLAWDIQVVCQQEMELPFKNFKVQLLGCFGRGQGISVRKHKQVFSPSAHSLHGSGMAWVRLWTPPHLAPEPGASERCMEQLLRSRSLLGLGKCLGVSATLNSVP